MTTGFVAYRDGSAKHVRCRNRATETYLILLLLPSFRVDGRSERFDEVAGSERQCTVVPYPM